jgi:hypothetical protein
MSFASEIQASQIFEHIIFAEVILVVVNVLEKFGDKGLRNNELS